MKVDLSDISAASLGAQVGEVLTVVGIALAVGIGLLLFLMFVKRFLYICRPNEVLIFSGGTRTLADGSKVGFRLKFCGRGWRKPIIERVDRMNLTSIPIEVAVTQAYSKGGIPLSVRAIANVKISSDPAAIGNAIERFLGKERSDVHRVARETLEGSLRGVLATLTPEQVNHDRLRFAESLVEDVADDFHKLGLTLDILKIQHVSDEVQYLESIGRARIANVIKEAEIAESNAKNEANKTSAEATSHGEVAQKDAERAIVQKRNDQRRIAAEYLAAAEAAMKRATAAGEQAHAEAEQELQLIRRELETLRLQADMVLPAEAERKARELIAKGEASPIEENGKAIAKVLELVAKAWAEAGPHAKDVFLIQQVEKILATVVGRLSQIRVGAVHVVDPGDGTALPSYIASFPATVTAVFDALKHSTGVDVSAVLSPPSSNGAHRIKPPPQAPLGEQRV